MFIHNQTAIHIAGFPCSLDEFLAVEPDYKTPEENADYIMYTSRQGLVVYKDGGSTHIGVWAPGAKYLKNAAITQQTILANREAAIETRRQQVRAQAAEQLQRAQEAAAAELEKLRLATVANNPDLN